MEAFANLGYEGAGTRELAERAGANLSAIRYHFGDKKGLYRAVIQHISEGLYERMSPFITEVRSRGEKANVSQEELIEALCHLVTGLTFLLLGSGVVDNWARLIIREQINPTETFPILHGAIRQLLDAAAQLIAKITGAKPQSERVRVCTMTIVGQALVFRTHRATALKFIGWKTLGQHEISALQTIVSNQCRAIMTVHSK
jgi:AcrR family transcriptional regulator